MSWLTDPTDHELWLNLLADFQPQFEEDVVDPAMAVDVQIAEFRRLGRLDRMTRLADDVAGATRTDDDVVRSLMNVVGMAGTPDGTGCRAWLLALQSRLHEVRRDPDVIPGQPSRDAVTTATLPRTTWFTNPDAANDVITAVLELHADDVRPWTSSDTTGWRRQHLYADLALLAAYADARGATAEVDQDRGDVPTPDRTEPTTGVVVVLNKGFHTGDVSVLAVYPERALDVALRSAYPDLCHWFGGHFYQRPSMPILQMDAACRSTQDPARTRVRDQLHTLLHEDDDTLRRVVEACGSYLLPRNLRHWVDRTLWRIDAFDWLGPDGELLRS